ncbi:TonB dependent receptor [Mucilaginibacter gotjawali]|nr:TonB dependent receptor [Mucilaginibacter gotjawali]
MLMLLVFNISFAVAQQDTTVKATVHPGWASGIVLDEYSQPLKGVNIRIKGNAVFTTSDAAGQFQIDAAPGTTLVFSYTGHLVRELTIKDNSKITVKLDDNYLRNPQNIDVLYGTQKKESELGAISTVYTNQLTTTPASLFVYAFPGQLAGVYTQQQSGFTSFHTASISSPSVIGQNLVNTASNNNSTSDNSEMMVTVRGQTPITVIDGVQREISSIDPESIESISVLKDGLSTILMGVNSSRPIVLVTTKRGEVGKPRITFTAETGLQKSLGLPTPLPAYQYAYLINETLTSDSKLPQYSAADFNAYRDHTDPTGHPDVNWFKTILTDYAPMTQYKLNVNGGSNIAKYSISLGYFDQAGIFNTASEVPYNTNNDLSRYIINSDVGVQVNKNLNVDLQLFGRVQTTTEPGGNNGGGYTSVLNSLYNTPNNAYPVRNPDGSFGGSIIGGNTGPYSNNLLSQTEYSGYIQNLTDDILANLDLNYNLNSVLKGLTAKLKGNLSYQSITALNRSLQNPSFILNKDSTYSQYGAIVAQSNVFNTVYTSRQSFGQAALNYERQFGKNQVNAIALYDSKSLVTNYDLPEVVTDIALKGTYNYDGKYFAEAAVNRSGNNRYPPGHQFGTFYAAGLGWQMGKESFIKDNFSWIDSWKWRGTYARTGNGNIAQQASLYYAYQQTYSNNNFNKQYQIGTGYVTNYYWYEDALANPYITWESADKIDFGMDISLFKDKFLITADYYHDKYSNVLGLRGNSIALLGAPYPLENIGINLYQGAELSLTYQDHTGNFNYFVTGNINLQASKIVYQDELNSPYPWTRQTGNPVNGVIYGYTAQGLYQTAQDAATSPHIAGYVPQAGDIKYKDLNGDGVINQFDESAIGGTKPIVFYGLNPGFSYKGFSLSVIIQGVTNRQIYVGYNNIATQFGLDYSTINQQAYTGATGRWTPETASIATLPRLAVSAYNNNGLTSSFYVRSGNYLRIKNAEVGYTFPVSVTQKLRLAGLRVFVNGENLATLAGLKGIDPEETSMTAYPVQRVINAGITVKL